ncbi:MAG: ABC transporter permease [Pseudomonadales bacterium]|nr:ABC transporter permease [Pseudomonadales bacterium]
MVTSVLKSTWAYRSFILGSIKRDIQARYKSSALGALWTIFGPLAMITVYTVVFSEIMRAKLPGSEDPLAYSIYLCSGVLAWGFFSESLTRATNVFIENGNLIQKLNFPRSSLPMIVIGNALFNFFIVLALFGIYLLITDRWPGAAILSLPILVALQIILIAGLGITLGVLNVFFRDVGQLLAIVLQFWFWLTPIVYPLSIIPEKFQGIVESNPLTPLIQAYQTVFLNGQWPDWQQLAPLTIGSTLLLIIGYGLFKAKSGEMVDEL